MNANGTRTNRVATAFAAQTLFVMMTLAPSCAAAACIAREAGAPSPAPSASPAAFKRPLYQMGGEVYTLDRDATGYYYFQGNRDGTAKVKQELRYDRNLWNTCAQLQIRLPVITRYPNAPNSYSPSANPYSGFGNAELRYSYNNTSSAFNHSLAAGIAFPTESNGVESIDTQFKLFYTTKWKWNGASISYANEYDQTFIRPPGASETSYYEGLLNLPEVSFVDSPAWRGLKFSTIYNFRVFFNDGGIYKSAIGANLFGNINDVALNVIDTWGIGANGLWKYKVEASAVAELDL